MLADGALVLIHGGQIAGVEPRMAPVPDGCPVRVLDGTLLPGLIDAHAHLCADAAPGALDTVLAWRPGAARGLPAVVASGTPITSTGGHCWALGGEAAGERALRAAVQERAGAGADVVKIMASVGVFTPGTDTTRPQFTDAEVAAAVTEAHALYEWRRRSRGGAMTDRSGSARNQLFPALRFPVYGLDSPFTGPRWLELFGDPPDGSPTWVSLQHQSTDGRSLIHVTTHVRRATGNPRSYKIPTDAQAAEQGWSPLENVACQGAIGLIDLTLPVPSLTRPPGLLRALVQHALAAASAYSEWPVVGWRVNGVPVQVRVWRFAGGWTAFTDAAAGVYLSVVGVGPGTGPEDLSFAALRDGSAYHFDLHGPLSLELAEASAEAAGVPLGSDPSWQSQEWHPDQLQLIRELGE